MEYMGNERRIHERRPCEAHFLVKIGLERPIFCRGIVKQISRGGLKMETDLPERHVSYLGFAGRHVLLQGAQKGNLGFVVMAQILRIDETGKMTCAIASVSNAVFFQNWIETG